MFIFRHLKTRIWFIVTVILLVLVLTVNLVATQNGFIYNTLKIVLGQERAITAEGESENLYVADYASKAEVLAAANAFNETVEEEGIILLKNDAYGEGNSLPLAKGSTISVFGKNSVDLVLSGSGSSGNRSGAMTDLYQSLTDAGLNYNETLKNFYEDDSLSGSGRPSNPAIGQIIWGFATGETPVASYTSEVKASFAGSDAALVVLSRIGGEGFDLPTTMSADRSFTQKVAGAKSIDSHYLELDENEEAMLALACENFENVIVLLNTGSPIELGFLEQYPQINACLWMGFPGSSGAAAVGRVLAGDVNPSGHTTDTWIADFTQEPSWQNLSYNRIHEGNSYTRNNANSNYYFVEYEEGIYVGYRYWETRGMTEGEEWYDSNVIYPFGYGLSYTDFSWEVVDKPSAPVTVGADDTIEVKVAVTNNGTRDGADVVQLYYTAPYTAGEVEKAHVVLGAFEKVFVEAGQTETVTLSMPVSEMKSYDYSDANKNSFKGYELEAGEYQVRIGTDAHTAVDTISYTVAEDVTFPNDEVTENPVENRFDDVSGHIETYLSRNGWTGYPTTPTKQEREVDQTFIDSLQYVRSDEGKPYYTDVWANQSMPSELVLRDLIGVPYEDPDGLWEQLLDKLSAADMATLIGTGAYKTVEMLDLIGKPPVTDADGPSGFVNFMAMQDATVYDTCCYAAETVLGATWNVDLAYQMGLMVGNEGLVGNERGDGLPYTGWYAPAVNIHRSPFGGRNWEYYAEDGLLSGKLAAQVIAGCKEKGVYCTVKHFAVNDQETNRDSNGILVWLNEQAMREIYLKPFEIAVKEGETTAIMSSFNRLGTTWAGGSYELLTEILREEWGFEGMVITDYALLSYMNADQMIRAGGDLMLTNDRTAEFTSNVTATQLSQLRRATKNILYTVVNSNAMAAEIIGMRLPVWVEIMFVVDGVIAAGLIAWGAVVIVQVLKEEKRKGLSG